MMNNFRKILVILTGWFFLVVGLALLLLGLYILPAALFGMQYEIPAIVDNLGIYLYSHYELSGTALRVAVLIPLLFGGVGFLLLSRYISFGLQDYRWDDPRPNNQITPESEQEPEPPVLFQTRPVKEPNTIHPLIQILIGAVIIFLLIGLVEYVLISEYSLHIR